MENKQRELLTVKDAAKLLNINEKKLYALAGSGMLPATKVTGKWIFPRTELEHFLKEKALSAVKKSFWGSLVNKKVLLLCGSDDPMLSLAQGRFHSAHPEYILFSSSVGSREGIRLLSEGFCTIAVSHLYDHQEADFTFPILRGYFPDPGEVVVVNLFMRNLGFVTRDAPVKSLKTCISEGLRFVNRQEGSGVRALVDHLLKAEGIEPSSLPGYEYEVFTHLDVVRCIEDHIADAGIASEYTSRIARLIFSPILEERFDMIVKKEVFFDRNVQSFVEFIRSEPFRELLKTVKGYSDRETGKVLYPK
jgi:putative molybdopterin biosynthesis protein